MLLRSRFAILAAAAFLAGCDRQEIRVYLAPKAQPSAEAGHEGHGHDGQPHPEQAARPRPQLAWTLPAGWQETEAGQVSVANFTIKTETGAASVNITPLPNLAGKESMVVNMWREQVGQTPLSQDEITATLVPVEVAGETGQLFEIAGGEKQQIVTAMMHQQDASWFFKLAGDAATVAAHKPAFIEFLKTVRIKEAPATAAAPASTASSAPASTPEPAASGFKWAVPEGWTTVAPGQMQVAKFTVPPVENAKADVMVSIFPNDTGGVVPNVNRWRTQIGLPEADAATVQQAVSPLDPAIPGALLIDLQNEPKRLIGAIVPRGDRWFFYKMLGESAAVAAAREAFVAFAKSQAMKQLWNILTSLRLTVTLLALSVLLVFFGTLAQVDEGLWRAQEIWFTSFLVTGQKLRLFNWHFPVPIFPGGYLIGYVLLAGLTAAFIKRFQWRRDKFGIHFVHAGVILLLLGQLITHEFSRESHLRLKEGETKGYSEAHRENELVFAIDAANGQEEVVSIPEEMVKTGATIRHEKLPFEIKVKDAGINAQMRRRGPAVDGPSPATQGVGPQLFVEPRPEAKDMDSRNLPYAYVELVHAGQSLGTWLVSPYLSLFDVAPQEITIEDRTWRMEFRFERYYKPFSVTLLKTTHEIYRGTDIPKNFRSRVRIENVAKRENREVDIYMNHPLRYEGLTFYQYQMGRDEMDRNRGTSTLQVVKNPSWLAPYAGCYIVAIGMYVQFRFHLTKFLKKRLGGEGASGKGRWGGMTARVLEVAVIGYMVVKFTFNLFGYG